MDDVKRLRFLNECQLVGARRLESQLWRGRTAFMWSFLGGSSMGSKADFKAVAGETFTGARFWDHAEFFSVRHDLTWDYPTTAFRAPWIGTFQPYTVDDAELERVRIICNIYDRDLWQLPEWNWYGHNTKFCVIAPIKWFNKYSTVLLEDTL